MRFIGQVLDVDLCSQQLALRTSMSVQLLNLLVQLVQDPYTQRNIKKIKQVQHSATRFVIGDFQRTSGVTNIISSLNWTSLQDRRRESRNVTM